MNRYIKLSNSKNRDGEVTFTSLSPKNSVRMALESGEKVFNKRLIKGTSSNSLKTLLLKYSNPSLEEVDNELKSLTLLSQDIINSDPEVDMEVCGRFIKNSSRIYINKDQKPVFSIKRLEKIYSPTAEIIEEREPKYNYSNITNECIVKWSGKLLPKKKIFNKLLFEKKYLLKHVNGLTYDFLYDMAKELDQKDAVVMLGGGEAGKEPLIMSNGGKPHRAFLEGRIKGKKYCLILHLTDQELKPI